MLLKRNLEKFDKTKTHANVGTIGHLPPGKSSLTDAIQMVLKRKNNPEPSTTEDKKETSNH